MTIFAAFSCAVMAGIRKGIRPEKKLSFSNRRETDRDRQTDRQTERRTDRDGERQREIRKRNWDWLKIQEMFSVLIP